MVTYKSKKFWLLSSSCKLSLPISDVTFTICTATRTFREKKNNDDNKAKSKKKKKIGKKNTSKKMFLEKIRLHFLHKTFN